LHEASHSSLRPLRTLAALRSKGEAPTVREAVKSSAICGHRESRGTLPMPLSQKLGLDKVPEPV